MKKMIFSLILSIAASAAMAQIDTASFPRERHEIRDILHDPAAKANNMAVVGDMVLVGAIVPLAGPILYYFIGRTQQLEA